MMSSFQYINYTSNNTGIVVIHWMFDYYFVFTSYHLNYNNKNKNKYLLYLYYYTFVIAL